MKKEKLSPWFETNVKPVHVGAYQVYFSGIYAWWDGELWGFSAASPLVAYGWRESHPKSQDKIWRGILK